MQPLDLQFLLLIRVTFLGMHINEGAVIFIYFLLQSTEACIKIQYLSEYLGLNKTLFIHGEVR